MLDLFAETVSLFHRLTFVATQVHGPGERSGGGRGILLSLERGGPQTVPQMARARPVSRQHIQMLVNQLAADGLVTLAENPAHKRSSLVHVTARGAVRARAMRAREAELIAGVQLGVSEEQVVAATHVLRAVREALESGHWRNK